VIEFAENVKSAGVKYNHIVPILVQMIHSINTVFDSAEFFSKVIDDFAGIFDTIKIFRMAIHNKKTD